MAQQSIAVVNDDTAFLALMGDLLSDEGYHTVVHNVGDTAFEMIKQEMPDLVILDIRLEHQDAGWVVLDLMRLHPATTGIPVILCSADALQLRAKSETLEHVGVVPMLKPFDLDDLLAAIRSLIGPAQRSEAEAADE